MPSIDGQTLRNISNTDFLRNRTLHADGATLNGQRRHSAACRRDCSCRRCAAVTNSAYPSGRHRFHHILCKCFSHLRLSLSTGSKCRDAARELRYASRRDEVGRRRSKLASTTRRRSRHPNLTFFTTSTSSPLLSSVLPPDLVSPSSLFIGTRKGRRQAPPQGFAR